MNKVMKQSRGPSSKQKKVTVKFFVNTAVQPLMEGKVKRFPLYMLITYDRKNTMIRCHYGQYYKDLGEVDKLHYPGLLAMEERIIRRTIDFEMTERGLEFDLKGLYKKYDRYCLGIHVLLDRYLKNSLWSILSRTEPYEYARVLNFTDPEISFDILYQVSAKIYKDLAHNLPKSLEQEFEIYNAFSKIYQGSFFQYTYPTAIEWLDKSATIDLKAKLKEAFPNKPSLIDKSITLIDRVIHSVLEHHDT